MTDEDTPTRLINAAGPIFAEKGYRDATVRELCDAAGVGLASVNYHFRDKMHLYVRCVESAFECLCDLRPRLPEHPPGTPPHQRLRAWVLWLSQKVMAAQRDSWQDRLLTRELHQPTPDCEEILLGRIREDLAPLLEVLEEVLPPETPTHDRWRLAFSVCGQCLFYDSYRDLVRLILGAEAQTEVYQSEQVADYISTFTLAALGLEPPFGSRSERGES